MNITSYQSKGSDESSIDHTEEVIIGSEQGTTFPTKIGTTMCNALIDTGATRCCISENPIGLVNCTFELGGTKFSGDFIVCKNLTRPLILGRDFLI